MGWIGVSNPHLFQATAALLQCRGSTTHLDWVKGHSGNIGNEGADQLANTGMEKAEDPSLPVRIPPRFITTGAKLNKASQSLLYRGIKLQKGTPARPRTDTELNTTRQGVNALCGRTPSNTQLWSSIRNKDFSKVFRSFIWCTLHAGYKCGVYWSSIPNYEHRGICPCCDTEETIEHILTRCSAPGQELIWHLAQELWEQKGLPWPQYFSYGMVLGCGISDFKTNDRKRLMGANRLWRILISESAHLIWKIRCECRIANEDDPDKHHSPIAIHNRWVYQLNCRLSLDRSITDKYRFGSKALRPDLVLRTWRGVILNEENLPENWIWQSGVLVGILPRRARVPGPDG